MSKHKKRASNVDEKAEERDRNLGHYFAPHKVAEIANGTIPEFDIDPCAHEKQLIRARALVIGSLLDEVDGYEFPWTGSCWLNPPNFKLLRKDVVANYPFHPFQDWMNRGLDRFKDLSTGLRTLMIYSPCRNGVRWYNRMMQECTLQFTFDQRVNCFISQRTEDGEELEPREMTSPFGGSSIFLFTHEPEVAERFRRKCRGKGVVQLPLPLAEPEKDDS